MRAETRRESGESESESESRDKEREKIIKILNAHVTVTMHICTVTIAIVHLCTILHLLMWVFFLLKMCKISYFLHFAHTDEDALTVHFKSYYPPNINLVVENSERDFLGFIIRIRTID